MTSCRWGLDKILIIAVLTSASASTQTTILPTTRVEPLDGARTARSRSTSARIHPRYLTPSASTIWMCIISIVCFVDAELRSSTSILEDSVTATGFGIAFYYGLTGFACTWYFRHELRQSARNFFYVGLLPLLGGLILFAILGYSVYLQTELGQLQQLAVRHLDGARDRDRRRSSSGS